MTAFVLWLSLLALCDVSRVYSLSATCQEAAVSKFDATDCRFDEKCTNINACSLEMKRQVKFAANDAWTEDKVSCESEVWKADNKEPIRMRCMMHRVCEQFEVTDLTSDDCPKGFKCSKPFFSGYGSHGEDLVRLYKCPANTTLEKNVHNGKMYLPIWKELAGMQCSNGKVMISNQHDSSNYETDAVGTKFRCKNKRGCDINAYYASDDCATGQTCTVPSPTFECPAKTVLQAKTSDTGSWQNIDAVKCKDDRFVVFSGGKDTYDYVPVGFRCMEEKLCKTQYSYYPPTECEDFERCNEPTKKNEEDDFKCKDDKKVLQVKVKDTWTAMKWIKCENNKMRAELEEGGGQFTHFPEPIRCVKLRCSECSSPCFNEDCNSKYVEFTDSKKWNECAFVKCQTGYNVVAINNKFWPSNDNQIVKCVNNDDVAKNTWAFEKSSAISNANVVDNAGSCVVEKKCSENSLAKKPDSNCETKNYLCETIEMNDYTPAECYGGQQMLKRSPELAKPITEANCNLYDGLWRYKKDGTLNEFKAGDIIYCEYKDCEIRSKFMAIAECSPPEKCVDPTMLAVDRYECPPGNYLRYHQSAGVEKVAQKAAIACVRGQIIVDETAISDFKGWKCSRNEYCKDLNPLDLACHTENCIPITSLSDFFPLKCGDGTRLVVAGQENEELYDFECDLKSGIWRANTESFVEKQFEKETNVYCVAKGRQGVDSESGVTFNLVLPVFLTILFIL